MNTKFFVFALAGAATLAAAPAHADTFDGPYVGVQAGWDRDEVGVEGTVDVDTSNESLLVGGYLGYNFKIAERFVLGAEAGISTSVDDSYGLTAGGESITFDPRFSYDLSARAGYIVNEKTLAYVRGGFASTRLRVTYDDGADPFSETGYLEGWQIGGGVERALTDKISARVEYRYSDLGEGDLEYDRHQALIGVSYNF
jgi:outer membrane immunogenic protein